MRVHFLQMDNLLTLNFAVYFYIHKYKLKKIAQVSRDGRTKKHTNKNYRDNNRQNAPYIFFSSNGVSMKNVCEPSNRKKVVQELIYVQIGLQFGVSPGNKKDRQTIIFCKFLNSWFRHK